jgi:hypothetical protein
MQQEDFIRRLREILASTDRKSVSAHTQAYVLRVLQSVRQKTGLSEIELASAFLPVLAVEQGIDLSTNLSVAIRSRVFTRADLAEHLEVDAARPIGWQLAKKGVVTAEEAKVIDGDLFSGRRIHLKLRISDLLEDAKSLLDQLQSKNLINSSGEPKKGDGYLFGEVVTNNFVELSQFLMQEIPNRVVILSLNGSVLYMPGGNRLH